MRFTRYLTEAREQLKDWQSYIRRNKELQAAVSVLQKSIRQSIRPILLVVR
jgi:hypothetical protein